VTKFRKITGSNNGTTSAFGELYASRGLSVSVMLLGEVLDPVAFLFGGAPQWAGTDHVYQISGFEISDVVAEQIDTVGDIMRAIEGRDLRISVILERQARA
jgi:hypothetical protein